MLVFNGQSMISIAQTQYEIDLLDTLCSPHFDGRGYVNNGDNRAADFIIEELQNIGVKSYKDLGYEQAYQMKVNTFPYDIFVALNDDTLVPGVDYIIDPNSGTAAGEFALIEINSENINSVFGGNLNLSNQVKGQKIFAFNFTDIADKERLKELKQQAQKAMDYFPVIWVTNTKKTYSVGRTQKNYPLVEIDSAKYNSPEKVYLQINNKYLPAYETKNVVGYIPGKKKNKFIVFTGHYDHLGRMGSQTYFPGANDNASGCVMLISLAKYFTQNPTEYSMFFCFFSGEEAGLCGSYQFVKHAPMKLNKIKFVLNIDIMGAADKGITVVNATAHENEFNKLVEINSEKKYLPEIKKRGPTANSDHHFFAEAGVPAFFIYSMGSVKNYHDVFDTAENTPMTNFEGVKNLLIDFITQL